MKKILLGNEAIVQGALEAGVNFVSTYPGTPASEIGNIFSALAADKGVYFEFSVNEKVALEAAIGASFSGLRCLVAMKNFGANVALDSLLPLLYTGIKGPMVIVIADDPSCWSSAQSEQNSRPLADMAHAPILEPSDPQECKDFIKLAFRLSEKYGLPIILRTTTRVAHQRMPVQMREIGKIQTPKGKFIRDVRKYITFPPRVLEMKAELLVKLEKMRLFSEKSEINKIKKGKNPQLGIITSGVSYLHTLEALQEMNLDLPVLKLGFFNPLPEKKIQSFIKGLKKVLIVEELEGYLEREVKVIAKSVNPKLQVFGKDLLPSIGELSATKVCYSLAKILGKKYNVSTLKNSLPKRWPKPCLGCPHLLTFSVLRKLAAQNPGGIVFGGDIGCYMLAGVPSINLQDYLFSMGSSVGIGHGISKTTNQKVIALIGDSTFFHAGIPALINTIFNKSNPLIIVLDNRTTAMTGHQTNPGIGKTGMGEETEELKIDEIARACGVKHVKVIDPANIQEYESTLTEFIKKPDTSLIVARKICALLVQKQNK